MNEFKYEELEEATENFSSTHLIGKGSHGSIYKGILKDGRLVAIKKQSLGLQKLHDYSKLDNEASILSSLPRNQYLVNVLGTSHDSVQNKVLVMEHLPNGTLHGLLHLPSSPPPRWPKRARMAIQIARAVQFLHESKPLIIHRDIKSANILLDSSWNARLADFGLALQVKNDLPSQLVNSVSPPAGTIGYLDPCYTSPCKLSAKNDVFSFGVVLLEIISGTKAIDVSRVPASIVEWASDVTKEHHIMEICDKRVAMPQYMEGPIRRLIDIAVQCVSSDEKSRPTIIEIVMKIEKCAIERARFPFVNMVQNLVLKRRRKLSSKNVTAAAIITTPVICGRETNGNSDVDITRRKLLVREILAGEW